MKRFSTLLLALTAFVACSTPTLITEDELYREYAPDGVPFVVADSMWTADGYAGQHDGKEDPAVGNLHGAHACTRKEAKQTFHQGQGLPRQKGQRHTYGRNDGIHQNGQQKQRQNRGKYGNEKQIRQGSQPRKAAKGIRDHREGEHHGGAGGQEEACASRKKSAEVAAPPFKLLLKLGNIRLQKQNAQAGQKGKL